MRKTKVVTMGAGVAGLGIPATLLGMFPGWAVTVFAMVPLVVMSTVFVGREVVTQLIRVRASQADPVGTHRVEAAVSTRPLPSGGWVPVGAPSRPVVETTELGNRSKIHKSSGKPSKGRRSRRAKGRGG